MIGLQTAAASTPAAIISTMQLRLAMVIKTSRRGMALKNSHIDPSTMTLCSRVARMLLTARAGMSPVILLNSR